MAIAYIPVSQRPEPTGRRSRNNNSDLESNTCNGPDENPFRMSVGQRQLVGMMIFIWFGCLWVGLKMMEAAQYSHRSPLLSSTNALLDTTDLYQSLTLPLLEIVNRTNLISTRCGTTTLEPHLLSFLTNDLARSVSSSSSSGDTTTIPVADVEAETTTATGQSAPRTRPYRYLFAIILQDSETVLPDLMTRVLETISILGADHCHLSIVDHASADATKTMLHKVKEFLDMYNRGDIQSLGDESSSSSEEEGTGESGVRLQQQQGQRKQYLSYTITTMTTRDESVENIARIKDLALDSLLAPAAASAVVHGSAGESNSSTEEGESPFDRIILLDPVVTCADAILELVFQSLLQDADVTCGLDLDFQTTTDASDTTVAETGKPRDGVYDSTITRDMLHQKLHRDPAHHIDKVSNDPETQTRFSKRLPFQVESCWSRAVVLRSSTALKVSTVSSGSPHLFSEVLTTSAAGTAAAQPQDQCTTMRDDRALFCNALWTTLPPSSSPPSSGSPSPPSSPTENNIIKMVVVPSIQFTDSPKEYVLQGRFDGWGLWPKTEKRYQDELETRLVAASHRPMYGYRSSTSSYGYIPRVEEDGGSTLLEVVFNGGGVAKEKEEAQKEDDDEERKEEEEERMIREIVPESTVELLKTRLEEIRAVFGVQDIQNAVLAKRDSDLITSWRSATVDADKADC
ncbi:capsular associated protein [Mortierella sp. NVP41]|nr:capsular associated protein [Mortierella sp. NVP41]